MRTVDHISFSDVLPIWKQFIPLGVAATSLVTLISITGAYIPNRSFKVFSFYALFLLLFISGMCCVFYIIRESVYYRASVLVNGDPIKSKIEYVSHKFYIRRGPHGFNTAEVVVFCRPISAHHKFILKLRIVPSAFGLSFGSRRVKNAFSQAVGSDFLFFRDSRTGYIVEYDVGMGRLLSANGRQDLADYAVKVSNPELPMGLNMQIEAVDEAELASIKAWNGD